MAPSSPFLSAAVYLPRRHDLITQDVEEAFYELEGSGFVIDPASQLRIALARRIPESTGDTPGARTFDGAGTVPQAIHLLRRISADYWGQIMVRGRFAIGGAFEGVTACVCPFSLNSPALFTAHILFRKPGLLFKDRSAVDRAAHAVEALDRLQDSFAPVALFLDTEQPELEVRHFKGGKLPWLPWAGYLSPGALRAVGGGALAALPDWLPWLEDALKAKGASAARRTRGGGLIFALPEPSVGQELRGASPRSALEPWRGYLRRAVDAAPGPGGGN